MNNSRWLVPCFIQEKSPAIKPSFCNSGCYVQPMYTTKEEQILAIKKRLNEAVDKINISTNKLKDELNDKYGMKSITKH